uniref:Ureidoglycolate hydrolase n=1 Tax=Cannabis sativa TaxID=3483 RepID=A0A803Q360_CANSA
MQKNMSLSALLQILFLCPFSTLTAAFNNEDPTLRTMEDFSGYPIHESHSFISNTLSSPLYADAQNLQNQIDELSRLSDTPAPSVTRVLYTEKDVLARRYIKNLMGLSGLSVREDAVGNIFGRWEGDEPELAAVATGSHTDAIPYSGKYDGVVGVLGAIEAINVLKRSGFKPKRSLEVILFTSEEPTRFGISCLGSRLLAGSEALAKALKTTFDGQNISFFDAARSAGYANDQDDLSSVFLKKGTYSAFVELHIEQGPILEDEGISIGIVTAIAAPASIKVEFEGNGGHAGAVLMPNRNDAGLAGAELALAVERHVLESGSIDSVGTVGILELHPGAINSIPSRSHLEIDTRDINEERRNIIIEKIHQSASAIAKKRQVKLTEFKIINQDPPALSEKSIIKAMEEASKELNLSHKFMISRAYHDSLFMASISDGYDLHSMLQRLQPQTRRIFIHGCHV